MNCAAAPWLDSPLVVCGTGLPEDIVPSALATLYRSMSCLLALIHQEAPRRDVMQTPYFQMLDSEQRQRRCGGAVRDDIP